MTSIKVKRLNGPLQKSIGLIGTPKAFPLFFSTRFGIHTFGVRFPIDVLILTKNNEVVKIKKNLLPNRFFFWNPKYSKVVELPAGEIQRLKIKNGETILLVY
jgi:uncharacterized membrane protein (UPF0127 family)